MEKEYKNWIFKCYSIMCKVYKIKNPSNIILRDINKSMGLHHREKWLQISISAPKKSSKRQRYYSESNWKNSGISLDESLVKESYINFKENDILLTWAEDTLIHELCHELGYMNHRKRFYRKYINMVNKYIAKQFNCSMLKVEKSKLNIALENKKVLLKH